jgi:hypothetical protein
MYLFAVLVPTRREGDSSPISTTTLAVAIWGAALSTLLGGLNLLDRRRSRRRVVQIEVRVFYRPTEGEYVVGLNIAATNLSERAVGLRQWVIEDETGKPLLAGSPHEGNVGTMLNPTSYTAGTSSQRSFRRHSCSPRFG